MKLAIEYPELDRRRVVPVEHRQRQATASVTHRDRGAELTGAVDLRDPDPRKTRLERLEQRLRYRLSADGDLSQTELTRCLVVEARVQQTPERRRRAHVCHAEREHRGDRVARLARGADDERGPRAEDVEEDL